MPRKIPRAVWLVLPLAFFLYFYHLGATGLLGPDEPRYASVAREMARSGDWITPRLWGEPWFEKPPLLYWMSGAAFRLGIGPDLSPRLPVALLAVACLGFYWWILNREFGCLAAWFSTLILGTSIAWLGFSQVGVTDLPFAATFSAGMLLALPWIGRGDARFLPLASALLGLALLAKSLVAVVLAVPLAVPLLLRGIGLRPRVWAPFLLVGLPWYLLCYQRNGAEFFNTLFVRHQFGRFTSAALQHVEPWWFYLPVVLGLLLPWTPLLILLRRPAVRDRRRLFLLAWVLFGLVFFSAATNKLPGYVLPLIPAAAALMGTALDEARDARAWLAVCGILPAVFLIAAPLLPAAVANGLSRAPHPSFYWTLLLPVALAGLAWWLESRFRRLAAVLAIAVGAAGGMLYVKTAAAPELDRLGSARQVWLQIAGQAGQVCVASVKRDTRYGLNYYSATPLPDCSRTPLPFEITQPSGLPPQVSRRP